MRDKVRFIRKLLGPNSPPYGGAATDFEASFFRLRHGMLTIFPKGGLGNQLFIYSAGRAVAEYMDCDLQVHTGWFSSQSHRKFELELLCTQNPNVSVVTDGPFLTPSMVKLGPKAWRLRELWHRLSPNYFVESDFTFDQSIFATRPRTGLGGYFQSWRYFERISETIESELRQVLYLTSGIDSNSATEGISDARDVIVHIRGTDYLKRENLRIYGTLRSDYYQEAIRQSRYDAGILNLIPVSDDNLHAQTLLENIQENFDSKCRSFKG